MSKSEIIFGKHEIIDDKRWSMTNKTQWDAYNNATTHQVDADKFYTFTAVNSGGMDLVYSITNNVLYKDKDIQGSYPLSAPATVSNGVFTVPKQTQAYTTCYLYEFTKVDIE